MCNLFSSIIRRRSGRTVNLANYYIEAFRSHVNHRISSILSRKKKGILHPHQSPWMRLGLSSYAWVTLTFVQPKWGKNRKRKPVICSRNVGPLQAESHRGRLSICLVVLGATVFASANHSSFNTIFGILFSQNGICGKLKQFIIDF